jgi:hypothetical protein
MLLSGALGLVVVQVKWKQQPQTVCTNQIIDDPATTSSTFIGKTINIRHHMSYEYKKYIPYLLSAVNST